MARSLEVRVAALEAVLDVSPPGWFTLARWRAAHAEHLAVSQAERRDLTDYADKATEIIAHYERVRAIRADAQETLDSVLQ